MATKNDRIAQLKSEGMPNAMVASLVGVTPSYVSQLVNQPSFQEIVARLQIERAEAQTDNFEQEAQEISSYKNKLAAAEHRILDNIMEKLGEMDDRTTLAALTVVGQRADAIRKIQQMARPVQVTGYAASRAADGSQSLKVVELKMPACLVPELHFGPNNEVTAIGERSVTPMPAAMLVKMMEAPDSEYALLDYEETYRDAPF